MRLVLVVVLFLIRKLSDLKLQMIDLFGKSGVLVALVLNALLRLGQGLLDLVHFEVELLYYELQRPCRFILDVPFLLHVVNLDLLVLDLVPLFLHVLFQLGGYFTEMVRLLFKLRCVGGYHAVLFIFLRDHFIQLLYFFL